MARAAITIFTKPDCSYCNRAKALLNKKGYAFEELNTADSDRLAYAATYFSGAFKLPQIFIGDYHIKGAEDLEALDAAGRLDALVTACEGRALGLANVDEATLARGAEDIALHDFLDAKDGSRSEDPEYRLVLQFYQWFFGFWPNCFLYSYPWLELDKHINMSLVVALVWGEAGKALPRAAMCAIGYSTSRAHGCTYCQTHTSANGGERSLGLTETLERIWRGEMVDDTPLGEFEQTLAQLAADASTNTVPNGQVARIRSLASGAVAVTSDPQKAVEAVAMMTATFGFLNIFNDLTGVKVEGDWYEQAHARLGLEGGKHAPEGPNPNNLDYDIPADGPTLEDMLEKYDTEVGDLDAYCAREFGLTPNLVKAWPDYYRNALVYTYAETMNDRPHALLTAELRHLMGRVAAIEKNHEYLAALEGFIAYQVADDTARTAERVRYAYAAAIGEDDGGLFTHRERAALKLAMISSRVPLVTPRRYVEPALQHFSSTELVHVLGTCGVVGSTQRFCAIAKPEIEPEVNAFLEAHGIARRVVDLRYPLPAPVAAVAS